MVAALNHTLSALQAFGQRLGFAGPGDRKADTGDLPEFEARDPVSSLDLQPPVRQHSLVEAVIADTTVYGFRANLKPVKAPDEVRGHLLNTLV